MKRFLVLLLAVFSLSSCDWFNHDEDERQMLLIYFAANNNLSSFGQEDLSDIKQSWLPETKSGDKVLLVFEHFSDNTPRLVRLSRDKRGNLVEDVILEYPYSLNSAKASTLSTVIADAEAAWPSAFHSIVLWSHASGFTPPGYFADPKESSGPSEWERTLMSAYVDPYAHMVKSFAEDHGSEIDIVELRKSLTGTHYQSLLFDCCFMGDVQAAYELKDVADYMVFSPTEILGDGLPYDSLVESIFSYSPEQALRKICGDYMAQYRSKTGEYASATITMVDASGLDAVAAACRTIFSKTRDQIMTIDRSQVQAYFRDFTHHWFYDIDDLVGRVADEDDYRAFSQAMSRAVVFKDSTPYFLGLEIRHYSGLSIYIPRPEYTVLNNYYKTLRWNAATGLVQ